MCIVIVVVLPCSQNRVPETDVEFVDISEDLLGRDVLHFICPECGARHESYRITGYA